MVSLVLHYRAKVPKNVTQFSSETFTLCTTLNYTEKTRYHWKALKLYRFWGKKTNSFNSYCFGRHAQAFKHKNKSVYLSELPASVFMLTSKQTGLNQIANDGLKSVWIFFVTPISCV